MRSLRNTCRLSSGRLQRTFRMIVHIWRTEMATDVVVVVMAAVDFSPFRPLLRTLVNSHCFGRENNCRRLFHQSSFQVAQRCDQMVSRLPCVIDEWSDPLAHDIQVFNDQVCDNQAA